MGYTHYLTTPKGSPSYTKEQFNKATNICAMLLVKAVRTEKITRDMLETRCLDTGDILIHTLLMGMDTRELAREFRRQKCIALHPRSTESIVIHAEPDFVMDSRYRVFVCCKTDGPGTPEDSLVVATFLAVQEAMGMGDPFDSPLKFHSDGDPKELVEGLRLFRDLLEHPASIDRELYLKSFLPEYKDGFSKDFDQLAKENLVTLHPKEA